jgi:hypothetical protein
MEPALLLQIVLRTPVDLHDAAIWPGILAPRIVPAVWLPADLRATWALDRREVPLAQRMEQALAAGLEDAAWAQWAAESRGEYLDPALVQVLSTWAERQLTALGLTDPMTGSIVIGGDRPLADRLQRALADAQREVDLLLRPLRPPRWQGPLLVAVADATGAVPVGVPPAVMRPALPVVHLPLDPAPDDLRPLCGALRARLLLDLASPPATGWPPWLRIGVAAVAGRRTAGELPSPTDALRRRIEAGAAALDALWSATEPDASLAEAVAVVLLHSRRVDRFPPFLDALRHGVDTAEALGIAYGLTVPTLLTER